MREPSTPCLPVGRCSISGSPDAGRRARGRVEARGLTWRPAGRRRPVLDRLDLSVEPGERVLVAGPSGSGKSTLLRALAGVLLTAESGDVEGSVRVDGVPPDETPGRVALLLQDPTAAVVSERVGRDVAFGPENMALPREQIWQRVHAALDAVGFPYGPDHLASALSGGESQRLALAGALALDPGVLLLDEPTSMLDEPAAQEVRRAVLEVAGSRGTTLVVVEHRIEPWLAHVDRLVVLDASGSVVADGSPRTVLDEQGAGLAAEGVWVPGRPDPAPVALPADLVEPWGRPRGGRPDAVVRAAEVSVRHRRRLGARWQAPPTLALDRVSARLEAGCSLALTGRSGAGKSTLLGVLAGLLRPDSGTVRVADRLTGSRGTDPGRWPSSVLAGRLSWVPQVPEHGIVTDSVAAEVRAAGRAVGREPARVDRRADGLLEALGLAALADRNPHHLSGGEQRRLVLAAALAHGPDALLLDEPTVGQDRSTWAAVLGCCVAARDSGAAVGAASHDRALVSALVSAPGGGRLALEQGRVVAS